MFWILPFYCIFCPFLTDGHFLKWSVDTRKFVHKFASVHPPDCGICLFSVTGGLCGQNFGSSIVGNTLLSAHGGRLFMARVTLDAVYGSRNVRCRFLGMNHRSFGGKTIFTPNYVCIYFCSKTWPMWIFWMFESSVMSKRWRSGTGVSTPLSWVATR